jgi:uncharacterized protein DUF6391
MNILEAPPISIIRRNHGIEHATVHILTERDPSIQLVGRADTTGFNIYGNVETKALQAAAREALKRLKRGEANLAVHPRCGTNLVVAGLLTALAAAVALGRRPNIRRVPDVILATTLAVFTAQPLGNKIQERITTSPDAMGARLAGIRQQEIGGLRIQHVDIEWGEEEDGD